MLYSFVGVPCLDRLGPFLGLGRLRGASQAKSSAVTRFNTFPSSDASETIAHPLRTLEHMGTNVPQTLYIVRENLTQPDAERECGVLRRTINQENHRGHMVRALAAKVGGIAALESLHADPLPDEPFDDSTVEAADMAFVADVVARIDDVSSRLLDVEYRTIAYRLLARVLYNDPKPVRRSTRANRVAASIIHAVLSGNGCIGRLPGQFRASDIAAQFGTTSVGGSARTLVRAAHFEEPGVEDEDFPRYRTELVLASPEFLNSSRRARLLSERYAMIATLEDHETLVAGRRPVVHLSHGPRSHRSTIARVEVVTKGHTQTGEIMMLVGLKALVPKPEVEMFALNVSEAQYLADLLHRALASPAPTRNRIGPFDEQYHHDDNDYGPSAPGSTIARLGICSR